MPYVHAYQYSLRFVPQLVTMEGPPREQVEICARWVRQIGLACGPQSHEVSGSGFVIVTS